METSAAPSPKPLYAIKAVSADGRQQIFQPTVVEVNLALEDKRARQAAAQASVLLSANSAAAATAAPAPVKLTTYRTINAFQPAAAPVPQPAKVKLPAVGPGLSKAKSGKGGLGGLLPAILSNRASASLTVPAPKTKADPKALLRSKLVAKQVTLLPFLQMGRGVNRDAVDV